VQEVLKNSRLGLGYRGESVFTLAGYAEKERELWKTKVPRENYIILHICLEVRPLYL
jgi:hypothetical protein